MTETQGDLLGSLIVLVSTGLLLTAVRRASSSRDAPEVRSLVIARVILSVAGVAVVILT